MTVSNLFLICYFSNFSFFNMTRKSSSVLNTCTIVIAKKIRLTHKHYLFNEEIPMCIACDCPLTIKHILVECADTVLTRQEYFNCHDLKTLFNSVAGDIILAYLSEINLIGSI